MSAATEQRTWQAELRFDDYERGVRISADPSQWDTLRLTARDAERQAAEYLREGLAQAAWVVMYKTTKARGTERDRDACYLWLDNGKVYVDRQRSC